MRDQSTLLRGVGSPLLRTDPRLMQKPFQSNVKDGNASIEKEKVRTGQCEDHSSPMLSVEMPLLEKRKFY